MSRSVIPRSIEIIMIGYIARAQLTLVAMTKDPNTDSQNNNLRPYPINPTN